MKASVCIRRPRLGVTALAAVLLLLSTTVAATAYSGPVESANARYAVATYQQFLDRDPADRGLDFHLDRLPIQPGTFAISTSLITKGHTYDYADREVEFLVRADHAITEPELARIVGRWSPAPSVAARGL